VLGQREAAGIAPLLETRVIEATELTMQRKASEADLASHSALLELNQLRGVAPGAGLVLAEPEFLFGASGSNGMWLALARTNNFELRAREAELAQQGFRVALAKNERFPSISVGPSYSEETALERDRVVSLGVSFPLPLWNRNGGNIAAARATLEQAASQAGRIHAQVLADIAVATAQLARHLLGVRPRVALLADRAAAWFVAALLALAAATAYVWWQLEPARALAVTFAVLVVSCPCALSLATPCALSAAAERSTNEHFVVSHTVKVAGVQQRDTVIQCRMDRYDAFRLVGRAIHF
jgi:hypothetical protein